MKFLLFVCALSTATAATLRISNYSLYNVVAYEQVSFNPVDDTGRITLIDPLAPVSQTDFTVGERALIRLRLRKASTNENYINTWFFIKGDTRIDVSQTGSWDIVPTPPLITVTSASPKFAPTFDVPIIGTVALPDWALNSPEAACFFLGFCFAAGVRIFRAATRWFKRAGTEDHS